MALTKRTKDILKMAFPDNRTVNQIEHAINLKGTGMKGQFIGMFGGVSVTIDAAYKGAKGNISLIQSIATPQISKVITIAQAVSLHLSYFKIYDVAGSVAVWYDVDNTGAPAPIHGCNRAIKISTVVTGDLANAVATKTAAVVDADAKFIATTLNNTITITDADVGIRNPIVDAGLTGFTVSVYTYGSGYTINKIISDYNIANPNNPAVLSAGNGTLVPAQSVITLVGGTDIATFDKGQRNVLKIGLAHRIAEIEFFDLLRSGDGIMSKLLKQKLAIALCDKKSYNEIVAVYS